MAAVQDTLGIGREALILDIGRLRQEMPNLWMKSVKVLRSTATYKDIQTFIPLGPADAQVSEGSAITTDDMAILAVKRLRPRGYGKAMNITLQTEFTDQYGLLSVAGRRKDIANSFHDAINQSVSDLNNLGFTATDYGPAAETYYSTTHASGITLSNQSTTAAFSPLVLQQNALDLRAQKNARGRPSIPSNPNLILEVPLALEAQAWQALNTMGGGQAGSADHEKSFAQHRIKELVVNDWLTSTTAFFLSYQDQDLHGARILEQMPFRMHYDEPRSSHPFHGWWGYQTWAVGWVDPRGKQGNVGA